MDCIACKNHKILPSPPGSENIIECKLGNEVNYNYDEDDCKDFERGNKICLNIRNQ